mmetsp:Transcript_86195/g.263856  ORF Transcript_86195/g.263856 Transcript_86195/m.263856 type:complete len:202 (+) Transcript_86195:1386-1991(+)
MDAAGPREGDQGVGHSTRQKGAAVAWRIAEIESELCAGLRHLGQPRLPAAQVRSAGGPLPLVGPRDDQQRMAGGVGLHQLRPQSGGVRGGRLGPLRFRDPPRQTGRLGGPGDLRRRRAAGVQVQGPEGRAHPPPVGLGREEKHPVGQLGQAASRRGTPPCGGPQAEADAARHRGLLRLSPTMPRAGGAGSANSCIFKFAEV